jgi:Malic enzyme, N-terminal domain
MIVQADAIANYSHLFRRSEGLYLTFSNQESMEEDFLEQIRGRDIDLVVCSDSEAILGIGDQGVGVNLFIFPPDAVHEQFDLSRESGYLQLSSFFQRWSHYFTGQISTAKSVIYT